MAESNPYQQTSIDHPPQSQSQQFFNAYLCTQNESLAQLHSPSKDFNQRPSPQQSPDSRENRFGDQSHFLNVYFQNRPNSIERSQKDQRGDSQEERKNERNLGMSEASEPRILDVQRQSKPNQTRQVPLRNQSEQATQRRQLNSPTQFEAPQPNLTSRQEEWRNSGVRTNAIRSSEESPQRVQTISKSNLVSQMSPSEMRHPKVLSQSKPSGGSQIGSIEKMQFQYRRQSDYEAGLSSQKMTDYKFLGNVVDIEVDTDENKESEKMYFSDNKQGSLIKSVYESNQDSMSKINQPQKRSYPVQDRTQIIKTNPFQPTQHQLSPHSRDSYYQQITFGGYQPNPASNSIQSELSNMSSGAQEYQQIRQRLGLESSVRNYRILEQTTYRSVGNPMSGGDSKLQRFALMGEKACMRLTLKELLVTMEDLNDRLYMQSLHQDIVLNDEDPSVQLNKLIDLQIRQTEILKSKINSVDSVNQQALEHLRNKSNVELIEQIRMDFQMMDMNLAQFFDHKENLYTLYAKERQRSKVLAEELQKVAKEVRSKESTLRPDLLGLDTISPLKDVNTEQFNLSQKSNQLSYIQSSIRTEELQKQLLEREREIFNLKNVIENLKKELIERIEKSNLFDRQSENKQRSHSQDKGRESEVEKERDHEMGYLKSQIQSLKNQNRFLEEQLKGFQIQGDNSQSSVGIGIHADSSAETREMRIGRKSQGHERLNTNQTSANQTHQVSSVHNRNIHEEQRQVAQFNSQSDFLNSNLNHKNLLPASLSSKKQTKFQVLSSPHSYSGRNNSPSVQDFAMNQRDQIRDICIEKGSGEVVKESAEKVKWSQHMSPVSSAILEDGDLMSDDKSSNPEKVQRLFKYAQDLQKSLHEQLQHCEYQKSREAEQMQRYSQLEKAYADLRRTCLDLQDEARVNTDALEKAQQIIQKLQGDMKTVGLEFEKMEQEMILLREENLNKQQKIQIGDNRLKEKEGVYQAKIQKIDQELNLEIKDIKQAFEQYQSQTEQEKQHLVEEIELARAEKNKQQFIVQSLETKHNQDREELNREIQERTTESLNLKNENLELKIQLGNLEIQLQTDLQVRDEYQAKQFKFLQDSLADANRQLNRYRQKELSNPDSDLVSDVRDKSKKTQAIENSYLMVLQEEFNQQVKEVKRVRELLAQMANQTGETLVGVHLAQFKEFRVEVLDSIVEWLQKSTELARTANKYYDTLEMYKMLFVEMKQLVKSKDIMLKNMAAHYSGAAKKVGRENAELREGLVQMSGDTLGDLKKMTQILEIRCRVKERESEDLARYLEDVRRQMGEVVFERDELREKVATLTERLELVEADFKRTKREQYDYLEELRKIMDIEDTPYWLKILPQHVEAMKEQNREWMMQIQDLETHNSQLRTQVEDEERRHQREMEEMREERDGIETQLREIVQEWERKYGSVERELGEEMGKQRREMERLNYEVSLKERQLRKVETRLEQEQQRREEVERGLRQGEEERQRREEMEIRVQELQRQVDQKQEEIDRRKERMDGIEKKLREMTDQGEEWRGMLSERDVTLQRLREQIVDISELKTKMGRVEEERDRLVQEKRDEKRQKEEREREVEKGRDIIRELNKVMEDKDKERREWEEEIRRYQDSITYLTRMAEIGRLKEEETRVVNKEREWMERQLRERERELEQIKGWERNSIGVQTDWFRDDKEVLRQELEAAFVRVAEWEEECFQLRELVGRCQEDIDRLIGEKRELEAEIGSRWEQKGSREGNISAFVRGEVSGVVEEQSHYISCLEGELTQVRRENERLKDRLIVLETDSLLKHHCPSPAKTKLSTNYSRSNYLSATIGGLRPDVKETSQNSQFLAKAGLDTGEYLVNSRQWSKPQDYYQTQKANGEEGWGEVRKNLTVLGNRVRNQSESQYTLGEGCHQRGQSDGVSTSIDAYEYYRKQRAYGAD